LYAGVEAGYLIMEKCYTIFLTSKPRDKSHSFPS
jgi:hypothetical protein